MNISIIGAGQMGNGIAQVFATTGHVVTMIDINDAALERGVVAINKSLDRLIKKERLTSEEKDAILRRLHTEVDLPRGVANADLVVEAASENLSLKLNIFEQLDAAAPEQAILATNTSSISITQIAAATKRPAQVIGMHFMNPVPIMKLVEVI
ncbi:MAG: 3-hydroxyacyl-CoA dehydrogenase NAD-binding domain-containing protein, partial [Bacteroidota bacterium]